tara:strand:+ start:54 stop:494 length:441 start_codon:yes stop_codon:yes gene_type:complete
MKFILISIIITFLGCNIEPSNVHSFNQNKNLNQLIDAYIFLSETHDLLHIMMGEHEGSPLDSYNEYQTELRPLTNNLYLKPILYGLNNIQVQDNNVLKNADKFDALVDYYQMGIQMMIEGLLKGYGYNGKIPQNNMEYQAIKKHNF